MADDGNPRVTALIKFYEEQAAKPDPEIPPHGVVISIQGLTGGRALLFAEGTESGGVDLAAGEPSVVINWWGDVGDTCARTFRNYLYSQAYVRGRLRSGLSFASLFGTDDQLLPQSSKLATDLRFRSYWFSDDVQVCMERGDRTARAHCAIQ